MKNELGVKIVQLFVEFRATTYSYIIDNGTPN